MIRYISFSKAVFALALIAAAIGIVAVFEEISGRKLLEVRNATNVEQGNSIEQDKNEFDRHFLQLQPLDFHF